MAKFKYYIWKWADNHVPGTPLDIVAAFRRNEQHPAIDSFSIPELLVTCPVLNTFFPQKRVATIPNHPGVKDGPCTAVVLVGQECENTADKIADLARTLRSVRMVICDASRCRLHESSWPKRITVSFLHEQPLYDFSEKELPCVMTVLTREPYLAMTDAIGRMVVAVRYEHRYHIEWFDPREPGCRYQAQAGTETYRLLKYGIPPANRRISHRAALTVLRNFHRSDDRPETIQWVRFSEAQVQREFEKSLNNRISLLEKQVSSLRVALQSGIFLILN